jgi:HprK-related kinase B
MISAGGAVNAETFVTGLTAGAELGEPLGLDIGGCRVDVLTNEPRLRDRLHAYFRSHVTTAGGPRAFRVLAVEAPVAEVDLLLTVKPPDAGKTRVKEEFHDFPDGRLVRKRLTGMLFVFGGDRHIAHGPCLANDNQVVNFVINRYMQWRLQQGYLLCHAGAVARRGRGLALCGASGAGKSTTSLALLAHGLDFVSNDRLLVRPLPDGGVEMQGVPKHPRVNPGTLLHNPMLRPLLTAAQCARYGAMPAEELRVLEQKHDVLIDQVVGAGRFRLTARMEALVVIAWNGDGPARIQRVDLARRRDLLGHVMKSPGLFYEPEAGDAPPDPSAAAYVEVLGARPTYEVTGTRDFAAAAALCLRALEGVGA